YGPGPDNIQGTAMGESLVAGRGDDLITIKGPDVVYAGAGDDEIRLSATDFVRIDGGAGDDLLRFTGEGITLDLGARPDLDLVDVETINIGAGNTLKLEWRDLRALSPRSHQVTIDGTSGALEADL